MIIDGYAHCGISKYEPMHVVAEVMEKAGVNRAVLCQHLGEYDNTYLAEVVGKGQERFAAACLVNPAGDALATLRQLSEEGKFRGVRVLAESLDPHFSLWQEALNLGMRLVLFAPDGVGEAVPAIRKLLAACPHGSVVVTHLGNPALAEGKLVSGTDLFELDQTAGVHVLLSGLSMFCEYPHSPLQPFVADVITRFGAQRVMWGSNFPVCGNAEAYARDLNLVQGGHWTASPEQIDQIVGKTAQEFWFNDAAR